MNFHITFLFVVTISGFINAVHGQNIVLQVVFNEGRDLYCGANCCRVSEWRYIYDKIYYNQYADRQLRGKNDIDEEGAVDGIANTVDGITNNEIGEARELQTYPRQCEAACAGYAPGRCMGIKCLRYRRNLVVNLNDTCENQKAGYQSIVNSLSTSFRLSTNCKALMKTKLLMTCIPTSPC
jgi:hypothetical protein